jgi:hypothetical protein
MPDDVLVKAGVEKTYSTRGAAELIGRSPQWIYWGLKPSEDGGGDIFRTDDGQPIRPSHVGGKGRRRYTLPLVREMAIAAYKRGNLSEQMLETALERIIYEEGPPRRRARSA